MADQEHEAIYDAPLVRRDLEERLKVDPPPADQARDVAPPDPARQALRAVLADPVLAGALLQEAAAQAPADAPPDDAEAAAQLVMALYLLQTVHADGKPGHEHLVRTRRDDDEREEER